MPPKSVTPFSLKKIREGGEGSIPQIRNSFFSGKKIRKGGGYPPYGQNPQSSILPLPLGISWEYIGGIRGISLGYLRDILGIS